MVCSYAAFYSRRHAPEQEFYSGCSGGIQTGRILENQRLGIGERLTVSAGSLDFADFQNFSAVEAFDVVGVVVFGDYLGAFVFAGGLGHGGGCFSGEYSTRTGHEIERHDAESLVRRAVKRVELTNARLDTISLCT